MRDPTLRTTTGRRSATSHDRAPSRGPRAARLRRAGAGHSRLRRHCFRVARARRAAGLDGENREARVVSVYSDERPPAKAEVRTGACDMGLGSSVFATAAFGLAAGAAAVDVLIADGAVAAFEHDVLIAESAARDDTARSGAVRAGVAAVRRCAAGRRAG